MLNITVSAYRHFILKVVFCVFGGMLFSLDIPDISGIKSFEQLKFVGVHEQQFDKSCGLSVISSILNLYIGYDLKEETLVEQFSHMLEQNNDLTMAQMIRIFEFYGHSSKAYQLDFENMIKATRRYAPVIVHYDDPDLHFAFLLYADDKRVITADPASGVEVQDKSTFMERWSGFVLLIKISPDRLNTALLDTTTQQAIKRYHLLETSISTRSHRRW